MNTDSDVSLYAPPIRVTMFVSENCRMELLGWKRCMEHFSEGSGSSLVPKNQRLNSVAFISWLSFPLLELPEHIICDIFSRLPVKNICRCKCISKRVFSLLKDPYFARVHLTRAPLFLTIITKRVYWTRQYLEFFPCDLCEPSFPSYSSDDGNIQCNQEIQYSSTSLSSSLPVSFSSGSDSDINTQYDAGQWLRASSNLRAEFYLSAGEIFFVVGSCNGLLCLGFETQLEMAYYICNPLLGEFIKLPPQNVLPPLYNFSSFSGFAYCQKTTQYKVISFMCSTKSLQRRIFGGGKRIVAEVHTLGSDSWRLIEDAPYPALDSFDPFFNGALHWITDSSNPSELISSFDLEKERFKFVPSPAQFSVQYMDKVSWINVGVLRDCLCICSINKDALFEVHVMQEYCVKESWKKEFSIDMKFYCIAVMDLHRPLKFLRNGNLWFLSATNCLVSFCPKTRTFKELSPVEYPRLDATAHALSFVSLKDAAGPKAMEVKNMSLHKKKRFVLPI